MADALVKVGDRGGWLRQSVHRAIQADLRHRFELREEAKRYTYVAIAERHGSNRTTVWAMNMQMFGTDRSHRDAAD